MIELNKKTQQDFLNREWVQRLLSAGINMSDAKYCIGRTFRGDYIAYKAGAYNETLQDIIPTYTVSELLYKLHEYIYPTIDGIEYSGGLAFCKDAPHYIFYYNLHRTEKRQTVDGDEEVRVKGPEDYIYAEFEYPIESLAGILIQCHQKDIGIANKNINISDK